MDQDYGYGAGYGTGAGPLTRKEQRQARLNSTPRLRNASWENWGFKGCLIGLPLVLFGLLISICEIVRIIYGITNRGIFNYDGNGNAPYAVNDPSLLWPVAADPNFPIRTEKFHYWPWSYAGNLFGLVIIGAGIAGIVSYYRRSYANIFLFMTLSLLAHLLAIFLIAYFSILVNYYVSYGINDSSRRSQSMHTSFGLVAANLAFSCVTVLLGCCGFFCACGGIRGCQPKGLHMEETANPHGRWSIY